VLYILATGKKPFDGDADLDVLMQVRKGRYEKPSELVKDFNPDVERFIARALRTDRSKRWQNAEQMADKLDAILVKLAQPAGPAVLKRWLETLAAKDGMKTPGETSEPAALPPPDPGTIELGSRDLELQDIAPPPEEPSTHAEPKPRRRVSNANEVATRAAPPGEDVLAAEAAYGAPTRIARAGRWLRRKALIALVTLTVLGVGGYFAQPYLPSWLVEPVHDWLKTLPPPIGTGHAPPPRPANP
jgi:serine/threonine-protein kinase